MENLFYRTGVVVLYAVGLLVGIAVLVTIYCLIFNYLFKKNDLYTRVFVYHRIRHRLGYGHRLFFMQEFDALIVKYAKLQSKPTFEEVRRNPQQEVEYK